ncbi:hypothetical protein COO60DRAFT_212603 [Scenedesmus sp. NREL 46B-D3]|nr:hypothetical protein COO60DRAFT_212603 [Scenedesmus sp. NREL 46B-D3]
MCLLLTLFETPQSIDEFVTPSDAEHCRQQHPRRLGCVIVTHSRRTLHAKQLHAMIQVKASCCLAGPTVHTEEQTRTLSTHGHTHIRQVVHTAPHTRCTDLRQEVARSHTQEAPRVAVALLGSLLLLLLLLLPLLGLLALVHAAAWCVGHCRAQALLQASRQALLLLTGLPRCVHAPSPTLQQQWHWRKQQ